MISKFKIAPKIAYLASIFLASIIFLFFSYKAIIAYLIHRELYGGGIDTLVLLRAAIAGIMIVLITLFVQFIKVPDLKSHKTILKGILVGWTSLLTLYSLAEQIKEEKNSLTEKEIYLLQQLAKKK